MRAILTRAVSLAFVCAALAVAGDAGMAQRTSTTTTVTTLSQEDFLAQNRTAPGVVETASGLQYKIIKAGNGPHPTDTDVALVNYSGTLLSGVVFDNSTQPTPLPVKDVVPGFAEALKLMNKGAKFRVWIPSGLAYGDEDKNNDSGQMVIPAHSLLVFDVEMLDFLPQSVIDRYQQLSPARKPPPAPRRGTPVRRKTRK